MKITVTNIITKEDNTLDIPITEDQLNRWLGGELIQNVMPELDLELREFLISGFLPGDFDKLFGPRETMFEGGRATGKNETVYNDKIDSFSHIPQHIIDIIKG